MSNQLYSANGEESSDMPPRRSFEAVRITKQARLYRLGQGGFPTIGLHFCVKSTMLLKSECNPLRALFEYSPLRCKNLAFCLGKNCPIWQ